MLVAWHPVSPHKTVALLSKDGAITYKKLKDDLYVPFSSSPAHIWAEDEEEMEACHLRY